MNARERFLKICRFQLPNAIYLPPYTHVAWHQTLERWVEEGAPPEILSNDVARYRYFGLDRLGMLHIEVNVQAIGPKGPPFIAPVRPRFESRMLEEDARSRVRLNEAGVTIREFKDNPEKMPLWLDYPVKTRQDWDEYKKRLDPHHPERWPRDWNPLVEKLSKRDYPVGMEVGSFFGLLREFVGAERLLYMFYDNPQFVEEMMSHMEHFSTEIINRAFKDIIPDFAFFWEDMAWKGGSMISPQMFREFMMPHYKRVTGLLRSRGVDIIMVDSDGDINELIPLWIESGVSGMWPLEAQAGMNAVEVRKRHGKGCILWGNIDKKAMAKGKEAIKEEIDSKVPFLISQGGYLPGPDHFIPPDVSLESFKFYLECLRSFEK